MKRFLKDNWWIFLIIIGIPLFLFLYGFFVASIVTIF